MTTVRTKTSKLSEGANLGDMNKTKFVGKAVVFLKKELSYDGDADTVCPHCHKVIQQGTRWLYHYESMAGNLAHHLGLTGVLERECVNYFIKGEYDFVSGNEFIDAPILANGLYEYLF